MSSVKERIPRDSASILPNLRLSPEESASGRNKAMTRSGPSARVQSAATTLLSMPPETATIAPFRLHCPSTASRMEAAMRSVSAAGSRRKRSGDIDKEVVILIVLR